MALPLRQNDYDDEEDRGLSAIERAEKRWGMNPQKSDDEHPTENLEDSENTAPTKSARERANESWGLGDTETGQEQTSSDEDDTTPAQTFSYRNTKNKVKGKVKAFGNAKKKIKKKVALAGMAILPIIVFIIMAMLFFSSLKIPHFMANITTFEFARLSRNFGQSVADVTEERFAMDAENSFGKSIRDKYSSARESTWGKLDAYRPQKVIDNMKSDGSLEYLYKEEDRRLFPGKKITLDGVKINGEEIRLSSNPAKWYDLFGKRADRLQMNGQMDALIQDSLHDTNTLVRGKVGSNIREVLGIKLRRWEKFTKEYRDAREAKAKEIRSTAEKTGTEPTDKPLVDGVKQLEDEAKDVTKKCLNDDACLQRAADDDAIALRKEIASRVNTAFDESTLAESFSKLSFAYSIAMPMCMIYEGSVQSSGPTVDANSARAQKTYYTFATAADQQKFGEVESSHVGGLADQLGDISTSPSEVRANGENISTEAYINPQASKAMSYSIFTALFTGATGRISNQLFQDFCPTITAPSTGVALAAGEILTKIIVAIGTAGTGEVAAESAQEAVTTTIRQTFSYIMKETFNKAALKSLVIRGVRDATLIGIGSELAKIIVYSRMGNMASPLASSQDLALQADQGANLTSGEINRQQLYGAPMDSKSIVISNYQDYKDIAYKNSQKSIYDRYLNPSEPNSALANTALSLNISMKKPITNLMQNIIRRLGSIFTVNNSFFTALLSGDRHKLLAAATNTTNNYNIVQWGWSDEEINLIDNNPLKFSPINNAAYVESGDTLQKMKDKYNECFTGSIGALLAEQKIVRDDNGNITPDKGKCSPNNLSPANEEAFRFRIYMRNQAVLDHLTDIQNPGEASTTATGGEATVDAGALKEDSTSISCPSNTKFLGTVKTRYTAGVTTSPTINLCQLTSIGGEGNDINGTERSGGAVVNSRVAQAFQAMGEAAKIDNINLYAGSSFRLGDSGGGSGTGSNGKASPGGSFHQLGVAIDFGDIITDKGGVHLSGASCTNRQTSTLPSYQWLTKNASRFGIKQFSQEAWHWDPYDNPSRC